MTRKAKASNFDPRKKYEWDINDEFSVTGSEINIWNRAINTIMATDEYQRFLVVQSAAIAMQGFLKEAVEEGLIKEAGVKDDSNITREMKAVKQEVKEIPKVEEKNEQPESVSAEVSD